jgi:hypothetical protein
MPASSRVPSPSVTAKPAAVFSTASTDAPRRDVTPGVAAAASQTR